MNITRQRYQDSGDGVGGRGGGVDAGSGGAIRGSFGVGRDS